LALKWPAAWPVPPARNHCPSDDEVVPSPHQLENCRHDDPALTELIDHGCGQHDAAVRLLSKCGQMVNKIAEEPGAKRGEPHPGLEFEQVLTAGFRSHPILWPEIDGKL
jgi:hypothetical protein